MNQPLRLAALTMVYLGFCAQLLAQAGALRIMVIKGEDAVNILQQKTAVAPVVVVRDRNNLPVAGATVVFTINGPGASFGAAQTVTAVTNAAGQATAAGLTPSAAGALNISAAATFQGQTATVTISQSNVLTAAEAARTTTGAVAKSGGISAGKVVGILGGIAAAGAGVAVAAGGSSSDSSAPTATSITPSPTTTNPTTPTTSPPIAPAPVSNSVPVISSASISPSVALVGANTTIAFQVEASDPDNDTLTYMWEFPDGTTSDQRAFTRVFQHGGVYTIRVNVRDGTTSTSRELTLNMKTMTGRWIAENPVRREVPFAFTLIQSGSSVSGTYKIVAAFVPPDCPMTGAVQSGGVVTFSAPRCTFHTPGLGVTDLPDYRWEFQQSTDGDNFSGTIASGAFNFSSPASLKRQ